MKLNFFILSVMTVQPWQFLKEVNIQTQQKEIKVGDGSDKHSAANLNLLAAEYSASFTFRSSTNT